MYKNKVLLTFVFIIPVLILLIMYVFGKRMERLNSDVAFLRRQKAMKNAKKIFKQAESCLRKNEIRNFYDFLIKGLSSYLADKLNKQIGSISGEIVHELKSKGLDENRCSDIQTIFKRSNEVLFSSKAVESRTLKKDFKSAKSLINYIERNL